MKGGVNETRAKQNLRNVTVDIRSTMSRSNYMSTLWVNIHSPTKAVSQNDVV